MFDCLRMRTVLVDHIQQQVRKISTAAGDIVELNFLVVALAFFCSIHILMKHRRNVSSSY